MFSKNFKQFIVLCLCCSLLISASVWTSSAETECKEITTLEILDCKTTYWTGEIPKLSNMMVRVVYNDGTETILDQMEEQFNDNSYYFSEGNFSATIRLCIEPKSMYLSCSPNPWEGEKSEIVSPPVSIQYEDPHIKDIEILNPQTFTPDNMQLLITHDDGTSEVITSCYFDAHAGDEDCELGFLYTNDRIFEPCQFNWIRYNVPSNVSVDLLGHTITVSDNQAFGYLDTIKKWSTWLLCCGSDTPYSGTVTEDNIDSLLLSSYLWSDISNVYRDAVPADTISALFEASYVFDSDLDLSLSKNYNTENQMWTIPDYGYSGMPYSISVIQANEDGSLLVHLHYADYKSTGILLCISKDRRIISTQEAEEKYESTVLYGDINMDGAITAVDARWALQIASGVRTPTNGQAFLANVNRDEEITAVDARWILQLASGIRTGI